MKVIVGVDEVGRGCWAGPVVAGAVILTRPVAGLKDSKKLSAKQRAELATIIAESAHVGLGWVSPTEVDELGLTSAVALAMRRAVQQLIPEFDEIIIDGDYNFLSHDPRASTLIKADNLIPCVSAASIVAKVARDVFMAERANDYPGYGFEAHVGYGTKLHREALVKLGVTDLHRKSYKPIKAFL